MENQAVTAASLLIFFVRSRRDNWVVTVCDSDFAGSTWGPKLHEEFSIDLRIIFPLRRDVILVVDSLNRAYGFTCTAVHALIGLYVEHASALIDAINWALFDARLVFHIDTGLCNYVRQGKPPCGQCRHSNPHGS